MSREHRAESNQKLLRKVPESNGGTGTVGGCCWLGFRLQLDMMFVCTHCHRMRQDKSAFVGAEAEREEMERKRTERAKRRKECQEKLAVPHRMHACLTHALVMA